MKSSARIILPTRQRAAGARQNRFVMLRFLRLGLWLALVWPVTLPAQQSAHQPFATSLADDNEFLIKTWETKDGLPENSATAIVQATDGHLWFGTFNGLVRFDGENFTTFSPANTPELPSEGIINLHLDQAGRLWVSTLRGIALLDQGRWSTLRSSEVSESNFARTISDQAGVVCITTFNGLVYRSTGGALEELPEPPGDRGQGYHGHVDRAGNIWTGQAGFFGHWDGQRWQTSPLQSVVTNQFWGMGTGRDGSLLVVAHDQLLRLQDGAEVSRRTLPLIPNSLWHVHEDRRANLWLGTQYIGLLGLMSDGTYRHYSRTNGLAANSIRCTWEDREGNVWLGTSGEGMMALIPRRFRQQELAALAPTQRMTALLEAPAGRLIVGSYGSGPAMIQAGRATRLLDATGRMPAAHIQALWRESDGDLWLGTYREGLRVLQPDSQVRLIEATNSGGTDIAALFGDSRGRLWIGGNETVAVYENGVFRRADAMPGPLLGRVKSFAESQRDGGIWAASPEGVFRFEGGLWTELKDANGQSLRESICVRAEADGTLWIGGSQVALRRLRDGRLSAITGTDGLPVNNVSSILDDGLGSRWLGSRNGVVRVALDALEAVADGTKSGLLAQLFTEADGLPSVECVGGFQATALKDSAGRLWFATLRGLAYVEPENLRLNTEPPPLYLGQFRIEDRLGRQTDLAPSADGVFRVPPGQNEVAAFFGALSFTAPEKVRFAYRIEGLHDSWIDIGNRRSLFFFPPPPGKYRLWIKAANHDGYWNEAGTSLAFQVLPFYWQSLWFRGLIAAGLLAGTGLTMWRIGRARLRRQVELLEQQTHLEEARVRLATVLEATSDLVGFTDREGRGQFLNAAGRRLLGLEPAADISRLTIRDFHPPWAADRILHEAIPAAMRDGSWSGESAFKHRDGHEIPVSQVVLVHRAADGTVEWISTMARDITERKHAEAALRRSEEMFSRTFRSSPVPIAISRLDTGVVIDVNEAIEKLTDCRREELLGRTTVELGFWAAATRREEIMRELTRTGAIRGREFNFHTRGGRRVVAEYAAELIEMNGEQCVLTVLADITQRKAFEEALQASEQLLRSFIKHSPAAVAMFDTGMRYLEASDRWLTDYRLQENIIGRSHYEVFPDIPERWKEAHRQTLAGAILRKEEDPFERADGSVEWLQWELRPWHKGDGSIGGLIMFTQVITARKLAEQKAREQLVELQRWQRLMLDREDRIRQLKREVNELCRQLGQAGRYGSAPADAPAPSTVNAT